MKAVNNSSIDEIDDGEIDLSDIRRDANLDDDDYEKE